ncbi:SDR family oxidoreductase [Paenibacillus kribbensis]|uniref:SDR family oxidoreductase n=1 Tax=Paenibacillus kribbensis TaxID=172713 RepID=UPI002DBDDD2C|nr:SDR family oxidoreductase [Paenibacillus kribbensis]MEC0236727.1 SDR family oxidoreductase [Paenibacillus kribbensis]
MNLQSQRVVVIGGSSGIGLATAIEAAKQGASIVIAGRSADKLEQAKKLIPAESVEAFQLNNQKEEEVQAFFEKVGAFDHLFTPGASYTRGPITIDTEKAKTPFEGKFWPQYFAAKHAVPHISRDGSIVLMSGAFSQRPMGFGATYGAANGAIESLGKALAVELAPVRVNVVSPGTIWRDGPEGEQRAQAFEEYKEVTLLRRVGYNEEIAHTVLYLMTNKFTTGSVLFPDGGYTLI